jgi:KilA-N domain
MLGDNTEIELEIRELNGHVYINTSKLCPSGKQNFRHYCRSQAAKNFAKVYQEVHGVDAIVRIQGTNGGCPQMWAVEEMANMYIMNISAAYAIKVMGWVKEWKLRNDNAAVWRHAIETYVPDDNDADGLEKSVVDAFCTEVPGALREVAVDLGSHGYVDVLTDTYLYEFKTWRKWRYAVGQVLCYGASFPTRKLMVVLFDTPSDRMGSIELAQVRTVCAKYNIDVDLVVTQ